MTDTAERIDGIKALLVGSSSLHGDVGMEPEARQMRLLGRGREQPRRIGIGPARRFFDYGTGLAQVGIAGSRPRA